MFTSRSRRLKVYYTFYVCILIFSLNVRYRLSQIPSYRTLIVISQIISPLRIQIIDSLASFRFKKQISLVFARSNSIAYFLLINVILSTSRYRIFTFFYILIKLIIIKISLIQEIERTSYSQSNKSLIQIRKRISKIRLFYRMLVLTSVYSSIQLLKVI